MQSPTALNPTPNISYVQTDLGDPTNVNRKLRGTVTVTGGPLTASITVVFS